MHTDTNTNTNTDNATRRQEALAAVLAHNDSYLLDLVERWEICPFAKRCRLEGRLWRRVVWATDADDAGDRIDAAIDALETQATAGMPEVSLLLCPGLHGLNPQAFNAVYAAARQRYQQRFTRPAYFLVAFHPDLRLNATSAASLVNFWRRSPHPTLQFVSVALLERIRHVDRDRDPDRIALEMVATGATPEDIGAALDALRLHEPISTRVAAANRQAFDTAGSAVFVEIQETIAQQVAADREAFGPWQARWQDSPWLPTGGQAPDQ